MAVVSDPRSIGELEALDRSPRLDPRLPSDQGDVDVDLEDSTGLIVESRVGGSDSVAYFDRVHFVFLSHLCISTARAASILNECFLTKFLCVVESPTMIRAGKPKTKGFTTILGIVGEDVIKKAGRKVTKDTASAWRAGRSLLGRGFPGGITLQHTGRLIRDVGVRRTRKGQYVISPSWSRRPDVGKRAGSSMGLLAIHLHQHPLFDPTSSLDPGLQAYLARILQEVVYSILRSRRL